MTGRSLPGGTTRLSAEGLGKRFDSPSTVEAVRDVSFKLDAGEFVALVGPSGAGKSTLLALLGGLQTATSGRVEIDGTELTALDDGARPRVRNLGIGFVFQFHHLLPELSALENVMLPGLIAAREGWRPSTEAELRGRAGGLLHAFGLATRADHHPTQLSGGEAQRVALARALMNAPAVVLADEPTGNLDQNTAVGLLDIIRRLHREEGQTFLIATHNPELVKRAGRVLRMTNGTLAS